MGRFVRGEVVVVPFPFSDLTDTKRRPALVVAQLEGNDLVLCQITSVNRGDKYAVSLAELDFVAGSLKHLSFICPNRIFTAESSIVIRSIGHISEGKLAQVLEVIADIFNR